MTVSVAGDSSDDELEWEEVHVPEQQQQFDTSLELELSPPPRQNIEITLQARPKKNDTKKKAAATLYAQRVLRTTCHKIHTVALLANAWTRNKWLNDPLLHARLLSITPLAHQNGFAMIHKSRVPDQNKRGCLFEAAVSRLVTWWCETFFSVTPTGHIRSRTFEEVEEEIALASESDGLEADDRSYGRIRSVESLMKHVLMQRGSRDTSAQLFTALCRALDIPARLVVSLQSVPWKSRVGKPVPKMESSKGKGKAPQGLADDHEDLESDAQGKVEDIAASPFKSKGKSKEIANSVIKLRKRKSQSNSRSESPAIWPRSLKSPDLTTTPPVFWTEVFSRADSRWLPVDPIRGIVNKRHVFDPSHAQNTGGSKTRIRQDNRMLYVIGIEEDGFGRDITARYARDYTAKVSKVQAVGGGPAGGRKEWWAAVVQSITRPYRLQRDDLEDDELHTHQLTEGMPTTIAGFKNHPLYALARHLRRDQVIDPPTELGKFRGEPVYPRSSVISLKTAENWMRQGRIIRQGCQPMKMVKQRAVTVSRQREMELALERAKAEGHAGGDEEVMQGLYGLSQTEVYTPEPIKDGKIPKNEFGNIDLYVPSMLPQGAVHIPFKGAAKIAKKLGFDYAEAVTGFEFRKRRAMPVIQGIVLAAENENVIVEACLEAEQYAEERARVKRLEHACKRWTRLVHGLRIRERLQKQYASGGTDEHGAPLGERPQQPLQQRESWLDTDENEQPGGYLTTADDVVEPFHLPRDTHQYDAAPVATTSTARLGEDDDYARAPRVSEDVGIVAAPISRDRLHVRNGDADADWEMEVEVEAEVVDLQLQPRKGVPKTMRELAESYAQQQAEGEGEVTPLLQGEKEADLAMVESKGRRERVLEEGTSRGGGEGLGRRTAKRRPGTDTKSGMGPRTRTRTSRTSKKRARRRSESEVDGEEEVYNTPPKRRQLEASVTPGAFPAPAPVSTDASTPNPESDATTGRVLRPRPQKSAARIREERAMEEAYRRAVAG
ncbi:hypothetical protein J3R82DRAFT_9308 [Butyriboletus roseoflavus]|nr:hypothetical protein J3R82DRAFT_9308 [Butyriboletus roseoflavus]